MWVPTRVGVGAAVPAPPARRTRSPPPAASQTRVEVAVLAHHLGAHHPVRVLVAAQRAPGLTPCRPSSGEPVDDVAVDHPGAQRALALLAADDAGVALEPLRRVGQPVGVVGVDHPVAADRRRAGCSGRRCPGRCASASVPHAQSPSARVPSRPGSPASWSSTRPVGVMHCSASVVGHVRHDRVVGVDTLPARSAAVVFTHGMPPPLSWRASRSRTLGGLAHLEERVDGAQLLGVGVADREEAGRRPRHQHVAGRRARSPRRAVEVLRRPCRSEPSALLAP